MSIQKTYNLLIHLYLMISDSLLARDKVVKNRNGGLIVVAVQSLSHVRLFATPWTAAGQDLLSSSISWGELKFMPIELVMLSNHLILSSPSSSAFNLSQHQGLSQWVSSSWQVAKVLELQLQHQSFNEYSGLISFRTGLISLLSKRLSRVLPSTTILKHQFFSLL